MRNGGGNTTQSQNYTLAIAYAFVDEKRKGNTTPTPNNALVDAFFIIGGATLHRHRIMRSPIPYL